ncbi:MAG: ABC-F family ATP-binding cassette domain-containing protein [Rhodothermales bacterium]
MLQLHNVSLAFGGQVILDNVSWAVTPGTRVGLIGPNGAGKTTLLRVMAGRQHIDAGHVAIPASTTLGYLEQDVQEIAQETTVLDEAMTAFSEVQALEAEEVHITQELDTIDHTSEAYTRLLNRLEHIHTRMTTLEAHRAQAQTEAILMGLGFEVEDLGRPLHTFSGGWRMRVALAKMLLQRPDLLLLDEPTNHLDIDSIDWLEHYLATYQGTVLIVSHDRYFLDRMINRTVELQRGHVTEYAGNYNFYLTEREERRTLQRAAYENQQKMIAETERFIERFRAKATKARQVQSRVKQLERLERLPPPPEEMSSVNFRFPEPRPSGKVVLELSTFSKTYRTDDGAIEVFDGADPLMIERGDKIALLGPNGAGKSTLARILRGSEPFDGTRKEGYHVETGFFAQHQAESLDPKQTILESLQEEAQGQTETELRSLAGAFLFTGDDVFKPIHVLSGGERSRVALARTMLRPANFLILDEPTNHLDIASINVLIEALKQYTGAFVVVSHDRHFLDQIATQVWRVQDQGVRVFLGNYTEYQWQIEHGTARHYETTTVAPKPSKPEAPSKRSGGPKTKEQKRREAEARRTQKKAKATGSRPAPNPDALSPSQLKQLVSHVERMIEQQEQVKTDLEAELADPALYDDAERMRTTTLAYEAAQRELADLYTQWESLAEQMASS